MWVAQAYPFRRPRTLLTSGGLGTMGFGLPAAIGAALAAPGRRVVCLSGDGSLTLPFMAVGAEGVISVASNLLVREVGAMVRAALANDYAKAGKLHRKLYPTSKAIFIEPNPVPIKAALKRAGLIGSDEVRAPLCAMSAANRQIVEQTLKALGH